MSPFAQSELSDSPFYHNLSKMDFLDELENMAINVADELAPGSEDMEILPETIARWQDLFDFTAPEAADQIRKHRSKIDRTRVSNVHWGEVHEEKPGHDKESYEFEIDYRRCQTQRTPLQNASTASNLFEDPASITYLLKLEGPLDTPQRVQAAASLASSPIVTSGLTDDGSNAKFCLIDGLIKAQILTTLSADPKTKHFHPTFVRLSTSPKNLSQTSIAPTLGLDATLPQHRLDTDTSDVGVLGDQFPVWYFFYGNLAKFDILSKLLSLSTAPIYHSASVAGATMKCWAGRYNAIVDGPPDSFVQGWAYRVQSQEDEDILRFHETGNYEVVRCNIHTNGRVIKGLTFRYNGPISAIA